MFASRVLPPLLPHPPPVATFFNIPRRYVKSNMQVGDNASHSPMEDVESGGQLWKSSRILDNRMAPTSSLIQRKKEEDISSPDTASSRIARKRLSTLDVEINGLEKIETDSPTGPRALRSASSTGSWELSGHVCLCQPEPKIPRPRNAFILYRQHHQHAIVARNPELANPEISKIIGEQWQAESEREKKVWQDLAQEEKARHSEQYPDYRYQPRRIGKPGSLPSNPSGQHTTVDKYRCPKCGGRSIKTPTSPFLITRTPTLPPPNLSENLTTKTRYLPMMSGLSLDSPAYRRPRGPNPSNFSQIQPNSPRGDTDAYSYNHSPSLPLTPGSKRPRHNNYPASNNGRGPYYGNARRDSLPPMLMRNSPPNTASMPPPRTPRDARRGSVDLNVLVPNQHDQSRSVEAMVMSVPSSVKIKVLGRITPPLKDPGPTSPAIKVRGAIIAIEGEDLEAVKELSEWLKDFLSKDKEYNPQVAEPPRGPSEDETDVTFEDYLDLIREWHAKSKELISFITTPITSSDSDSEAKERGTGTPSSQEISSIKPVAILPTYQLHASDTYASRIPIQDSYSPTDHWQWMATLWRGTVGPDLTIYVKNLEGKEEAKKLVELEEQVRCLTVYREKGASFESSALRRVGFEVGEWIQSVGQRNRH
ncbi:hypothetical protein K504DRAFT_381956 [Pleomassaria siparia CBS 279.74]|uniref:HMG box domain-containing protein n=1 Tax=Pleomassaria siparia CBS 279.74 TaxID=1314801 RepID=A0A6G1K719_9PLEO|nr:hypothetical protein K504DRAFT_381956 [Pleomassaria siparia CBS 279.74]